MIRTLAILVLTAACIVTTIAQDAMTVGEEVKYRCMCFGQEWVGAKVERISGGDVRIRFGNLDNQVITLPMNSPLIRRQPKPEDPEVVRLRVAFANNIAPKYGKTVQQFAQFYDPQYPSAGGPVRPEEWRLAMAELAELDTICRGEYRGVRDFVGDTYIRPGDTSYRFAMWCDLAAKRTELEPKARAGIAKTLINLGYTDENLNFGFNEPDNPVRKETQQLIWERAKWRAEKIAWLKPKYAEYGTAVPADATSAAERRADELLAMVERGAPGRTYKQPPYHDAGVESLMKTKFAAEYPGAQVLKIGLDYRTWVKRESLTYVASDEIFNYYKVNYNSYKRGTVLLKIPGRPFCQMQDWVVGQGAKGPVAVAVGGSGTFMRCE